MVDGLFEFRHLHGRNGAVVCGATFVLTVPAGPTVICLCLFDMPMPSFTKTHKTHALQLEFPPALCRRSARSAWRYADETKSMQ